MKLLYINPLPLQPKTDTLPGLTITVLGVSDDFPVHNDKASFTLGETSFEVTVAAIESGTEGAMENAVANHLGQPYYIDLTQVG